MAWRKGLSSTAPTTSPGRKPSVCPKARTEGSLASNWAWHRAMYLNGWIDRFAAPTSAIRHVPWRRLSQARCSAVAAEEHMVSSARLGPDRLKKCEIRLAMLALDDMATAAFLGRSVSKAWYCWYIEPVNTPTSPP